MNTSEKKSVIEPGVTVRRPLCSEWVTIPLEFHHTGFDTRSVTLSVEVSPGITIITHVACDGKACKQLMNEGRVTRRFIHQAILTDEGPATKIDKLEIDGYPFQLYEAGC
jgi:hypothetical protein